MTQKFYDELNREITRSRFPKRITLVVFTALTTLYILGRVGFYNWMDGFFN